MTKKLTKEEFIQKSTKVHGNKYDYSKSEYINFHSKLCIICPIHGEFWQMPYKHINGQGCPNCSSNNFLDTKEFIQKAKKVHGNKYDYSKSEYLGSHKKVCIICPIHGEFWQISNNHLSGSICPKCAKRNIKTTNEFINKAKEIHGDKYDYSKVKYINNHSKICIICSKHGEFWQTPLSHLNGKGCPQCNQSHLENEIYILLKSENIKFEYQKKFNWLGLQSIDFYLNDYNIGIECQGIQHFFMISHFGGYKEFIKRINRDKKKEFLCKKNNIKILYYSNLGIVYPYDVFENKEKLINTIKNIQNNLVY